MREEAIDCVCLACPPKLECATVSIDTSCHAHIHYMCFLAEGTYVPVRTPEPHAWATISPTPCPRDKTQACSATERL